MALTEDLFKARVKGYALGIRGYEYNEFGERLSERARANLDDALAFLEPLLASGQFDEAARLYGWSPEEATSSSAEETQ